jgi:hypothetical protein
MLSKSVPLLRIYGEEFVKYALWYNSSVGLLLTRSRNA